MGGGEEGGEEQSRGGRRNFTWGAELIKCIDPNEGEALRRGPPSNLGGWSPPRSATYGGGGGREDIGYN